MPYAHMPYALYYATVPAPQELTRAKLDNLVPVHFSSEKDALHAAVLVLRGGQHVWLIDGPDVYYGAAQVNERCEPILRLFRRPGDRR
jgi:hypothetical protein